MISLHCENICLVIPQAVLIFLLHLSVFWQRYMAVCHSNKATLHDLPSISIFNQCLQYSTHGRFPLDEGQLLIESSNFQPSRNLMNNLHLHLPDTNMATLHDFPWISFMEVFRLRMNNFLINSSPKGYTAHQNWTSVQSLRNGVHS